MWPRSLSTCVLGCALAGCPAAGGTSTSSAAASIAPVETSAPAEEPEEPPRPLGPAATEPGLTFALPRDAVLSRHDVRPGGSFWNVERYKLPAGLMLDVKTYRRGGGGCEPDASPLDPTKVRVSVSEKRTLGKLAALYTEAELRSGAEAAANDPFRDTVSWRVCTEAGDVSFTLLAAQRPKLSPSERRLLDPIAKSVEVLGPIAAAPPAGFREIHPPNREFRAWVPISAGPIKDEQGSLNFGVKGPNGVAFLAKCEDLPADPATLADYFTSYRRGIVGEAEVKSERTISRAGNIGSEIEAEMREPRVSVRARVLHDTGRACMFLVLSPPGVASGPDAAVFLGSALVL